jgi:hypothetical protein
VAYDPQGRIEAVQVALAHLDPEMTVDAEDVRRRWGKANYNVAQSRRYATHRDPHYREAFRLRMNYQASDLMVDYFAVRALPWHGEKEALRHWHKHDPGYLELFRGCLGGSVPEEETMAAYEKLVGATFAPVGEPWPTHPHAPGAGFETSVEADAWWSEFFEERG